jgi:DNA ligase-1
VGGELYFKEIIMERFAHPIIYAYDSKGRVKQWQIGAQKLEDGTAEILSKAGLQGGKLKTTKRAVKKGKNIGKSNETTPYQQALNEAASKHQKKLDAGYVLDITNYVEHNFPMKAQVFEDPDGNSSKHHIRYPAHATRKLNGLCTIAERNSTGMICASKTRVIDYLQICKHLAPGLAQLFGAMDKYVPLHGELYKHGWTLEEINRCAKKYRPGRTEQLELHVYDLVDPDMTCAGRDEALDKLFAQFPDLPIKRVPYEKVKDEQEFKALHDLWVKQGYEGACIRNTHAVYEINVRSKHLQKFKDGWQDAEFTIIGGKAEVVYTGENNEIEHKCIVYECQDPNDLTVKFDVRPKGSVEARAKAYANLANDLGKLLTVKFFQRTETNNVEFPTGLQIREPE